MANSWYHAVSSAKRYGGDPEEYAHLHRFLDEGKQHFGDFRHRALRHHTLGIKEMCDRFGDTFVNSVGRVVPVNAIGEQHMIEDFGFIPTVQDWLSTIQPAPWMNRNARRLSEELEASEALEQAKASA